jgi:hypothetical protein
MKSELNKNQLGAIPKRLYITGLLIAILNIISICIVVKVLYFLN